MQNLNNEVILGILPLLIPVILLHYGLAIYCIIDISKNGVKNINKVVWILISLFIQLIGPIAYLIFGRKGYDNRD